MEIHKTIIKFSAGGSDLSSRMHSGCLTLMAIMLLVSSPGFSQELEPRSLVNVPVGTNFAILGYGFCF